jgi:hypothetical protein
MKIEMMRAGGSARGGGGSASGLSYNALRLRDSQESYMYVLTSRRRETGQVQSRDADGLQGVYDIGLALLNRGDELINISGTKDAFPVPPEDIQTGRAARARYAAQGLKYEPLPPLRD